ncbi:MAG TPA: glutaredoxin domain-containing protein [Ignavibacteriaceae bacterium]
MKVEIYGTETCSYCKLAVSLCENNSVQYDYVDVGNSINLQNLTERMGTRPRTVPQIFLDGTYLPGGFMGLQQELVKN